MRCEFYLMQSPARRHLGSIDCSQSTQREHARLHSVNERIRPMTLIQEQSICDL